MTARVGDHALADLEAIVADVVGDAGDPWFAAVTGSRLYGWAGPESDVDVRGCFLADGRRYALLDRPTERVAVDASDGADVGVDVVSYELRRFGELLAAGNFNAIEAVCCGRVVTSRDDDALTSLRGLVRDHLPLDVPARYAGMARQNRATARETDAAKTFLYALRGALAAHYVRDEHDVVADVHELSRAVLGDADLADDLVAAKRRGETVDAALAARAARVLDELLEREFAENAERSAYRADLDAWMRDVRGW